MSLSASSPIPFQPFAILELATLDQSKKFGIEATRMSMIVRGWIGRTLAIEEPSDDGVRCIDERNREILQSAVRLVIDTDGWSHRTAPPPKTLVP